MTINTFTYRIAQGLIYLAATVFPHHLWASGTSAVVLQYHHVSTHTPPSTSVTPKQFEQHIVWLLSNGFVILPLLEVVGTLQKQRSFTADKVAALTFDDANISVCATAWPILQRYKLPFTVFISTEPVEKNFESQCSWMKLQAMVGSGLMTSANHSHRHLNMVSSKTSYGGKSWRSLMSSEILTAQDLIQTRLNSSSPFFAYPYGEYNASLSSLVSKLGFIGFGQHTGAIGFKSDFSALPRIPVSAQYASLETLKVKLLSLPFPATVDFESENPIGRMSRDNPPRLEIRPEEKALLHTTQCFNGLGEKLLVKTSKGKLYIQAPSVLAIGRHRYTCTSKSPYPDRFYWLSHQWIIE